jgi:hypothetical protein
MDTVTRKLSVSLCVFVPLQPSIIAVFWSNNTKENTPQYTIMEPSTVYGINKR